MAMIAAVIVAGFGAVQSGFSAAPDSTLATDLESLMASGFEVAPLILLLVVGIMLVSWIK